MLGLQHSLSSLWPTNCHLRWKGWGWSGEQRKLPKPAKLYRFWQPGVRRSVPELLCMGTVDPWVRKGITVTSQNKMVALFVFLSCKSYAVWSNDKPPVGSQLHFLFWVNNMRSLHCLKGRESLWEVCLCSTCQTNCSSEWKIWQQTLYLEPSCDIVCVEKKQLVL